MASARKLAATVYLRDEDDNIVAFGPDDTVPAWAAAKIDNPKAWAGADEAPADAEDKPKPARRAKAAE